MAEVLSKGKHPDAKKLCVCTVDAGADLGELTIVTGADNAVPGLVTALAPLGSAVWTPSGASLIKRSKVRGVESEGMLCSLKELGLLKPGEADPTGAVVLKASAEPGAAFDASLIAGDDEAEEVEEAPAPAAPKSKAAAMAAALGMDDDDDDDDEGGASSDLAAKLTAMRISPGDAAEYAAALSGAELSTIQALEARNVGEGGLREQLVSLGFKSGHARLLMHRLAAADALALDISRAGVRPPTRSPTPRRCAARATSAAELDGAGLDAAALSALGIKRGHARLLAVELCGAAVEAAEEEEPPMPTYDFGASRPRRRGPSALASRATTSCRSSCSKSRRRRRRPTNPTRRLPARRGRRRR